MKYNFLKIFYIILWILGIFIFAYLVEKINITIYPQSKIFYWSSITILISAFLASTSAILSIENSKKLALKEKIISREKTIVYLQHLLIATNYNLNDFKMIYETIAKNKPQSKQYLNFISDSFMTYEKMIASKYNKLENSDLIFYLDNEKRLIIINICIELSKIINSINLLISSNEVIESSIKVVDDTINSSLEKIKSHSQDFINNINSNSPSLIIDDKYEFKYCDCTK